jgi:hypothetical protein
LSVVEFSKEDAMTSYRVIVKDGRSFTQTFDGEPQINLTFENEGKVYKVITRAHDEVKEEPTIHAELI